MAEFHFVEDYRQLVRRLMATHDIDEAMSLAVGGDWETMGKNLSQFVQSLGLKPGMKVLDFGCGSGRLAHALSRDLDLSAYVGIDIVEELLDYATMKCPDSYKFAINHSLSIPIEGLKFDYAFGFSIYTHLLQTEIMLYSQQIFDLLKPGGRFVYSFLELENHWDIFEASCNQHKYHSRPFPHLNMFLDRNQITIIAEKCGYTVRQFIEPEDGIGQSVVELGKPV